MEKKFALISCSYSFLRVCCCSFSGLCGCVFRAGGYGAIHHQQGPVTRARGPFAQQSRPFSTVGKSHITTSTIQQLPPSSFSFRFVSFLSYVYVYKYILDIIIIHSYSGLYLYLIYGLNSSLRVLAYYCTLCSYSQSASTTSYTTVQRERQRESFVPCL